MWDMDGGSEVETEHVEKITRTSSLQLVSIEDSGLKNDALDETELYDVAEVDNSLNDIEKNKSSDDCQGVNHNGGSHVYNGVSTSVPSEVDSNTVSPSVGSVGAAHVVSFDSSHSETKIGQADQQHGLDHSSEGNHKGDISADDTLAGSGINKANISPADSSFQNDLAAEVIVRQAETQCDEDIQQHQQLNHDCCETVKDSVLNESAQIAGNLTNGGGRPNSVSGTRSSEYISINGACSSSQSLVEQDHTAREINVLIDNDAVTSDIPTETVDIEAADLQHSDYTAATTDVSDETTHSTENGGPIAVTVPENEVIISSDESTVHVDQSQGVKQSMEELCSSITEPEEHDHHTRCELLSHEHISQNNSCSSTVEQPDAGRNYADKESWLYLLGHDRLKKRILKPGEDGKRAGFGHLVTVRCCGRLDSGTEVDRYENLQLVVGDGDFIQAFDIVIPHMDRGEVCELVTDASYAYGTLGRKPDVPANAAITYEIELCSFEEQPEYSKLPISERLQLSNIKRERGNYLYSRNECTRAIIAYAKALKIIGDSSESLSGDSRELQLLVDARVKCYNNLAAAQLKVEEWDAALQSINYVLRIQPTNVKALFRKAKCLSGKGEYDAAIAVLQRAAKLNPETKAIQQELTQLEKRNESQKKSQKAMYEKMMGFGKKPVKKSKEEKSSSSWWWAGLAAAIVAVSGSVAMYRRLQHS